MIRNHETRKLRNFQFPGNPLSMCITETQKTNGNPGQENYWKPTNNFFKLELECSVTVSVVEVPISRIRKPQRPPKNRKLIWIFADAPSPSRICRCSKARLGGLSVMVPHVNLGIFVSVRVLVY